MSFYSILGGLSVILGPIMRWIYGIVNNYGWSIVIFTLLIRVVSFPLALHSQKSMAKQSVFMPMVQEIQKKYRSDPQRQNEELTKLQQEYGYNPTGGCLPQLLNMLILFGVIEVIYYPLQYIVGIAKDSLVVAAEGLGITNYIYTSETAIIRAVQSGTALAGVTDAESESIAAFNAHFLGVNLCEQPFLGLTPLLIFPAIACITMIFTNVYTMKASGQQLQGSMKYMPWMMSIFFAFICFQLPVAFSLYYAVSNVLMLVQTIICKKIYDPEKFKKQYAEELAQKKKEMKKRKTVTYTDQKSGQTVTKEMSAGELARIRLEKARALDAAKYADERTTRLDATEPAKQKEKTESAENTKETETEEAAESMETRDTAAEAPESSESEEIKPAE